MIKWNLLHQVLEASESRHLQLFSRFEKFAKHVEIQVAAQGFHIKGIAVSLHLEQGFFTITFAGRTLFFVFSSTAKDGGALVGNVTCYIKREFPEQALIEFGKFVFTGGGQTTLIEPEDNDPLTMDADISSLYIALHFIHESLSQ